MLFTILAILTVAGAVAAMSLRNLVHSVLALTLAFAGLAMVYLQLGAQFIGFAQILVYIGAVAILIVFAILLTRDAGTTSKSALDASVSNSSVSNSSGWGGGVVALAVFAAMAWAFHASAVSQRALPAQPEATMQQIGNALMLQFALPLEVIGVLLTAALIGAVTIAMHDRQETR
ncbi:MAG: NADH-quinone oxidoreductase subunit J family protein [Acidobacteriaceae bacterium]